MRRTGAPQMSGSQSFVRAVHFQILNPLSAPEGIKMLKSTTNKS